MAAEAPAADQMSEERQEGAREQKRQTAEESSQKPLSAIDRQYAAQTNVPRRIHMLGTGAIGKLVAHALRGIDNPPPVTLLLHRYKLLQAWERGKKVITVQDGEYTVERGGYDVELIREVRRQHGVKMELGTDLYTLADQTGIKPHEAAGIVAEQEQAESAHQLDPAAPLQDQQDSQVQITYTPTSAPGDYAVSDEPIYNLIVTNKTTTTVNALDNLKHRLSKESTICFLQNGLGVIDDLNKHVFPDEETRPNYVQGVVGHGANVPPEKAEEDPFFVVHAGHGTLALGAIPRRSFTDSSAEPPKPTGHGTENDGKLDEKQTDDWTPTARYMLRTLTRTPALCAIGFTPIELFQLQLEKLVINTVINPLTALLDNRNGTILYNQALSRSMRLMIAETSAIIKNLPELRNLPNVPFRFSPERLETLVVGLADRTRNNISSMLADVRAGRRTEIEFMNGYIVKRGEELGIKAVVNYAIMQVVIGKAMMVKHEVEDTVPVKGSGEKNLNFGE